MSNCKLDLFYGTLRFHEPQEETALLCQVVALRKGTVNKESFSIVSCEQPSHNNSFYINRFLILSPLSEGVITKVLRGERTTQSLVHCVGPNQELSFSFHPLLNNWNISSVE